jgi:superoxide oxidase
LEHIMHADMAVAMRRTRSWAGRFDRTTIALHWLTLLLVVAQFTTALMLAGGGEDRFSSLLLLAIHRSTGVVTWWVVVGRLLWRAARAHLPPFPASMSKLQQSIAKANEYGLYALLILQPLTGLGDTAFRGRPFVLFGLTVPEMLEPEKAVFQALHAAHVWGAIALALLIALHAGAALLHGVALRDGVLQRMLPWTASDA